ncbi:MAG: AMP-binding protein [Thermoleophilia bacterium]
MDEPRERGHGGRPALRAGGAAWTFDDLGDRIASAAGWLAGEGVRRGDVVLLVVPDSPRWIALFLALARRGAVVAVASPDLPTDRLRDATQRLCPSVVVGDPAASVAGTARVLPAHAAEEGVDAGLPDPGPAPVRRDDVAYLLLTSGSTGPSKWAVHRAGDIAACCATYGRRVLRLRPDDVTWSVAALPTSYGLGNSCYFPLAAGASAVVAGADRSPAACADACALHGVTALFGVPTSWARLARHVADGRVPRAAFSTVRLAVSAGEHLPAEVWRAVERTTGLRLVNGLGSSEASNLYLSDRPGNPRPGTAGWPVAGYEVRLRAGAADDPGEGELLVRGPTIMRGYLGDDLAGAAGPSGGWLATGDILRREADGSHTYVRRAGDRFKAGAMWVDAQKVRAALVEVAGVGEAAVLPVRDGDGLVRVGAAAVAHPGAGEGLADRIIAGARSRLRPHEVPRALLVLEALPTTASGKLDRAALHALLAERLGGGRAGR